MSRCRLSMMSKSDIEQTHAASLQILEESGALIWSHAALHLLEGAGAKVVEKDRRVLFPEDLVKDAIRSTAKEFVLGARNKEHDLKVPSADFPYMCTEGFPVSIRDSDTLVKRASTSADLEKWARLADYVPAVDFLWPSCGATDLPSHIQLVSGLRTCYENCEKHVQYQAFCGEEARIEIDMARAVAGGEEENMKRPHFSSVQCIVAPLQYDGGSTDAVIEFARAGIPVVAMSMVTPGMTGPVTMAGSLALANAEVLASTVVSQLASEGSRVFYCLVCAPLDMKSGNFATGSPEYGILSVAGTEMAKRYGMPSMMGVMGTSAKWPSVQVGFEKAITSIGPALAGCDLVTGLGGLNDAAFVNMEQMLIDSQIWEDIKRTWQGMEASNEQMAMDVILKLGPKGQYLSQPHTFSNFRKLHISKYSDRSSYTTWEAAGKKDMYETVHEEVKNILATHKVDPLPKSVKDDLDTIIKKGRDRLPK